MGKNNIKMINPPTYTGLNLQLGSWGSIFQRVDQIPGFFRHNKPSRNRVLLWESKPIWED